MKTVFSVLCLSLCLAAPVSADESLQRCLLQQIATADDSLTMGELRRYCDAEHATSVVILDETREVAPRQVDIADLAVEPEQEEVSAIRRRLFLEKKEARNPFALLPHKPNYIILSNNMASPHEAPFELDDPGEDYNFKPWETKFQISLKLPVVRGLFNDRADFFVAYTNRSFWQQFNKEGSSPFRETNHEPEAWLSFHNDLELLGFNNPVIRTGISHQSNGQSGSLSRSWNRLYADFILERGDLYLSFKPWWRIPESRDNDDNRDIEDYLGNFELGLFYKAGSHHFDMMLRNNLDFGDNHGAVQLGWSFPLGDRVRGYVQWFNGYGESLIDYDAHSNSIGFGIQLSDWL